MKLSEIPYEADFYWKGQRYGQVIRPKNPPSKTFIVVCRLRNDERNGNFSSWVDMPSGRKVKPVIRMIKDNNHPST